MFWHLGLTGFVCAVKRACWLQADVQPTHVTQPYRHKYSLRPRVHEAHVHQHAAVRFSLLWAPTSQALGMALEKHADVAWPLVLEALRAAQADHLAGTGTGLAPGGHLALL